MEKCKLSFILKAAIVSSSVFFSGFLVMAGSTLPELTGEQMKEIGAIEKFIFEQREGEVDLSVEIKEDNTVCWCKGEITDMDVSLVLGKFDGFTKLSLQKCAITDEILKKLPKGLTELDLSYTKITDEGLKSLHSLRFLTQLDLWECNNVTSKGMKTLNRANDVCINTDIGMNNRVDASYTSGKKRCIVQ